MTSLMKRALRAFSRRRHIQQRLEQIRAESSTSGARAFTLTI